MSRIFQDICRKQFFKVGSKKDLSGSSLQVAIMLTKLSEQQRRAALDRHNAVSRVLELGESVADVAREKSVTVRTLQRWIQTSRRHGFSALATKKRVDSGAFKCSPRVRELIEGFALTRPKPSLAAIHRRLAEIGKREGFSPPSYGTVRRVVGGISPGMLTLAHEGPKAYDEKFGIIVRRESGRPNEMWQADHSVLDILVRDALGNTVRPWLTVVIDDYSRAIAGYSIGVAAPSILTTALVLRWAIWRKGDPGWKVCGIPECFYTDHGSDFTSLHLEQVAAQLKIQLKFSTPGKPQGRGRVERFFRTVDQLFLCEQPGYSPGGSPKSPPELTLAELDERFRTWIRDGYHHRIGEEMTRSPLVAWEDGGFIPSMPESLEHLDLLLLTVPKTRRVRREGISFVGERYFSVALAPYVGEDVVIRYDPRDISEIRVFLEDTFVCRAQCSRFIGEIAPLKDVISARNRQRAELKRQVVEKTALVDGLLAAKSLERPELAPAPTVPPRTLKRYINE
jgi:putative transposase